MAEETKEKKIRKVSINTKGLSRDEILECIGNHVYACQKAVADLWAKEGETDEVNALRESFQSASEALQ